MTSPIQQTDRDLLIRVDADLKNLGLRVKDVSEQQQRLSVRTESLTESLQTLTYNVGALVKGMEKAEAGLNALSIHDLRIKDLETIVTKADKNAEEFRSDTTQRLEDLEQKFDRGFFLAKVVTAIIGSPVALAATIYALQFAQSFGK